MEMQNIGDFSDLIDSDIALLQATSKIGVVNSYFSGHVGPTHGYLKSHLKAALGIDENSDFGDKNFLNALRESLQEMYALVFEGAVELATKVDLKYFSSSFFMGYALSTNKDWSSVDVEKLARYYNLQALVNLAKFEEIKHNQIPNALAPEHAIRDLVSSNYLIDSLFSALLSERELRRDRSIRYEVTFDMLKKGWSGIRVHEARDESNARISAAAKKKWLPLIHDVHERLKSNSSISKSDACRYATKFKEEKWVSLRNVYNIWIKNPEEYEEELN